MCLQSIFKKLNYFVLTLRYQRGGRLFRHTTNLLPCSWSMKWYITKLGLMVWIWDCMVSKLHCWPDIQKPRFANLFHHFKIEFQNILFFGKMDHFLQMYASNYFIFCLLLFINPCYVVMHLLFIYFFGNWILHLWIGVLCKPWSASPGGIARGKKHVCIRC